VGLSDAGRHLLIGTRSGRVACYSIVFSSSFFFATVFCLYLVLPHRWQNRLLLLASYLFYGAWDWRFLLLLILSTTADFYFALALGPSRSPKARRGWVIASVVVNLTFLGFFKYYNFFIDSLVALLHSAGWDISVPALRIVLPIGISFYTFQAMSYMIDVYRGVLPPARRWSDYALFVAFFPHMVAGPIMRPTSLLPQVQQPRVISDYGISHGAYLILWGLFQKVVVADNLSRLADAAFNGPPAKRAAGTARHLRLRPPDLLRLRRLLQPGTRPGANDGLPPHAEFPQPILRGQPERLLETLAHQPLHLAARLPLHPARGQQARRVAHLPQPDVDHAAGWLVARRRLAVHPMGRVSRRVTDRSSSVHAPRAQVGLVTAQLDSAKGGRC